MSFNKYKYSEDIEVGITREQYNINRETYDARGKAEQTEPPPPTSGPSQPVEEGDAWIDQAACKDAADPSIFYPQRGELLKQKAAESICAQCVVTTECLDYALEKPEKFGIWGGTSERARSRIRRLNKLAAPIIEAAGR